MMKHTYYLHACLLLVVLFFVGCDDDNSDLTDPEKDLCSDTQGILVAESNSLILLEIEEAPVAEGWTLVKDNTDATGQGYLKWEGGNKNSSPGSGLISIRLDISTPGTYRFIWRSAVKQGDEPTESNDSWLRFPDADDFYGEKGTSVVYPSGTGKTPNPQGASKDGWFKVYRSGNPLDFKWQSRTSDHDAHDIFVRFDTPGQYTLEISGRSDGHAIDRILLFRPEVYSLDQATSSADYSVITCEK